MLNPDRKELIKLVEKDIQNLKTHIFTDVNTFELEHIQQSKFDFINFNLLIDFEYFENAVKSVCYQLRFPLSTTIGPDLSIRLQLFSKIFFSKIGPIDYVTIRRHWSTIHLGDFEQSMFIMLLFALFRRHLITNNTISDIFFNCLDIWETCIDTEKIPVNILIQMPNIKFEKDFELIKGRIYTKVTKTFTILSDEMSTKVHNSLLVYRTQLSCKIYTSVEQKNSNYIKHEKMFEEEWNELTREIQDIVFSFYLNHIDFDFNKFSMEYPWWFEFDIENFLRKEYSTKKGVNVSEDVVKSIISLYPVVVGSKISTDDDFITASHHYMTLHNRAFFPDVILDASVLLEFLFSRESKENIAFQISCNAGLFLAKTGEEFLYIFKFIKGLYSIRSALFHGDKWETKLQKFIEGNSGVENNFRLVIQLKEFFSSCLKKLIFLKGSDPQILADVNQHSKEENKKRKGEYLTRLATTYENNKNYSESLRMYVEVLKIYEEIKDSKKVDELLKKIKMVYDRSKNVLIFSKELEKNIEELELIIRAESDRKEIAEQLLEVINRFVNRRIKDNNPKLELDIDGTKIMEILKIKPSEKVGKIKDLLIQKVLNGELRNQNEDLTKFVELLD